jgi:photosystem II stability/assembly factor-like uncharacterized protein
LLLFCTLIFSPQIIISQQLFWKHTGGPNGGIVGDIGINSQGDIYAGAYPFWIDYSGLYRSTDNGDSWQKIETQVDDFEVYALYITKDDHIWVGTNYQGRIYLSTDNGKTWDNKASGYNTGECWTFGESKDGVMFAGDAHGLQLYRSTDYGENWEFSAYLEPLAFATDSNNIVYAGTETGLYKTTDNGLTWIQNSILANIIVSSILIDTSNNIYCGTGYYNYGDGVYYSSNGGEDWTHLGLDGMEVLSLARDSEGNLFAGTNSDGLYFTSDMGQNWILYERGLYKKQIFRLKINQQNDIFIGSEDEGVFRSKNGGLSFEQVGLPISNLKDIVFSGDSLIFASTPSGVQKFDRESKKWNNIGLHHVESVGISPSNILYASTYDDGFYLSTDFGGRWSITNLTIDTLFSAYTIAVLPDETILVATELNLRRSTDLGETWLPLPVNTSYDSRGICINTNLDIWAVGWGGQDYIVYKSTDGGFTFSQIFSGIVRTDNNSLASFNNYIIITNTQFGGGFYISMDNGINWENITINNSNRSVYVQDNGNVFIGGSQGILFSDDFGENWININDTISSFVLEIEEDINGKLFFGTWKEGLFEVDLITGIDDKIINIPNEYKLFQNYPNPFNSSTNIKYNLPIESNVKLKFFSILGEEILIENLGKHSQGEYEYIFNASSLPSGIYFYRLETDEFTSTRKMILLR